MPLSNEQSKTTEALKHCEAVYATKAWNHPTKPETRVYVQLKDVKSCKSKVYVQENGELKIWKDDDDPARVHKAIEEVEEFLAKHRGESGPSQPAKPEDDPF